MPKTKPLAGRGAIITGANQGLGEAIATSYVLAGADVLICARDAEKLETVRVKLAKIAGPEQKIIAIPADVSKPDEVARLSSEAFRHSPNWPILVNNAGIYGPKGWLEDVPWDEWVRAIEVNLFGSVLMCRALVPHMKEKRYGKIVQLSGGGATNPLPKISAYAASKAAIVRLMESLAEEVREYNIDVNAIAPGLLNTRLLTEILDAGPEKVGPNFYERMVRAQKENSCTPLQRGADLAVFLGSAESDGMTGKLISAQWDPWENLPNHRRDLHDTDIYTLRRIIPSDRGFTWGQRKSEE